MSWDRKVKIKNDSIISDLSNWINNTALYSDAEIA